MALVTGINSVVWSPVFAIAIVALVVFASYRTVARIFKWLTLVLFAYVITAFLAAARLEASPLCHFRPAHPVDVRVFRRPW